MNEINIVACASDNFTMPCGIMFYSVCVNNPDDKVNFFLITDDKFRDVNVKKLEESVKSFGNTLTVLKVDDRKLDSMLQFESKLYTRHVFYRLFMAELLPNSIEKALYLDCDIIVRHSLNELWSIDIAGKAIGCVTDACGALTNIYERLHFPQKYGYFNSGVLLANLKFWRDNNLSDRFVEFIKQTDVQITLPDQDVLNCVLYNAKTDIPIIYNSQTGFLHSDEFLLINKERYKPELEAAVHDPVILHFAGTRPWIENCSHPYTAEYIKYKNLSAWKEEPLWKEADRKKKKKLKDILRPFLSIFGLCRKDLNFYRKDLKLQ